MTDELPQESPQHEFAPAPQVSAPLPTHTKKSRKKIWVIVGVAFVLICLCSIACVALVGTNLYKVSTEKAPAELVLDNYMRSMASQNAESAYALFSPRAQRQIPISEVQEMLQGNNYFLFVDYQSLSVSNIRISTVANTDSDVPQGTVANVTGIIQFDGGIQGSFNGTLEKVEGNWMIDAIYVTVPPEKIK